MSLFEIVDVESNSYASDKANVDNIISQGIFEDLISSEKPLPKGEYFLTAGDTYEERLDNCAKIVNLIPEGGYIKPIDPTDESEMIAASVRVLLFTFPEKIAMICSGKSTVHVYWIYNGFVLAKDSFEVCNPKKIYDFFSELEFETIFLGGLFSIIANNHSPVSNRQLAKCSIDCILAIHRDQRFNSMEKCVKGDLGDFVDDVLFHYRGKDAIVGGRPQKK